MQVISDSVSGILTQFAFMNFYVIDLGESLAVVDTGTGKGHIDRLESDLNAQGRAITEVEHILITHCHPDHMGGLAELQRRTNAHTYAHRLDAAVIRGERAQIYADPGELRGFARWLAPMVTGMAPATPARVDSHVEDGDRIEAVGATVVHLPGHSYGQVGFLLAAQKLLLGGDVVIVTPFGVRMPIRAASPDWEAAKRSIKRVAALEIETLCVGHGRPIVGGAAAAVGKLAARL